MKKIVSIGAVLATLALAGAAHATIYDFALTVSDPGAGLAVNGNDNFGNVAVNDAGGNLAFDVTINADWELRHASDSNHWTFGFNADKAVTYSGVTFLGGGVATATEYTDKNASPFGTFTNIVDCDAGSTGRTKTACQPGWTSKADPTKLVNPTELKFTALGLQFSDLQQTSASYGGKLTWFIADLVNAAGKTGNVGAQDCITSTGGSCFARGGGGGTPEPATWALMLMGVAGVGAISRRRRQEQAGALSRA
jgi:hypothetical protein